MSDEYMASINNQDPHQDLEIKDAQVIFKTVWETLEVEIGHENLRFPKELILLGGAPGSGKGTHTLFISGARGLTCPPVVVSDLLVTADAQKIKDRGGMVGDKEVVEILFRKLLEEDYRDGAILDGFPRTLDQTRLGLRYSKGSPPEFPRKRKFLMRVAPADLWLASVSP